MKSKIFPLIAMILLAQIANAQFTVGAKLGANLTKIDGKSFKEEFKTGYHAAGAKADKLAEIKKPFN